MHLLRWAKSIGTTAAFAAVLAVLCIRCFGPFQEIDREIYSLKFPTKSASPGRTAVVDIDDLSLQKLGGWPLDRAVLAKATKQLIRAGAAVVVVDIVFAATQAEAGDDELAELARSNKAVVFAYESNFRDGNPRFYPKLMLAGPSMGYIDVIPDGVNKQISTVPDIPRETSIALEAAQIFCKTRRPACSPRVVSSATNMQYESTLYPVWGINFDRQPSDIRRIPLLDVLAGKTSGLEGKIAIVSPSASIFRDRHFTPLLGESKLPGALVMSYAIETAINGTSIKVLDAWALALLLAGLNVALLAGARARELSGWKIALPAATLFLAVHWLAFRYAYLYLPPVVLVTDVGLLWIATRWRLLHSQQLSGSSLG